MPLYTKTTPANVAARDHNLVAWSFDPGNANTGTLLTAGTVYLAKLHIRNTATITKLYWYVNTAGVTPTAGQNEVGLYSPAGVRLAQTNVDADISSTGLKTTTITTQTLLPGSFVWAAMVFNAATTPTVVRGVSLGTGTLINIGLTAAEYRYATAGTLQATLPASFTPASNALLGFSLWAAIGA